MSSYVSFFFLQADASRIAAMSARLDHANMQNKVLKEELENQKKSEKKQLEEAFQMVALMKQQLDKEKEDTENMSKAHNMMETLRMVSNVRRYMRSIPCFSHVFLLV